MHSTHLLLLASVLSLALHASTPDQNLVAKTRDRIRANQLTAGDRKFDRIAWVPTITEALRLAKETRRPVFLLTYYGDLAISSGRVANTWEAQGSAQRSRKYRFS